jgi:cytochrome c oxidase subunit 4
MARPYLTIFAALLALTLVTVFVASLHLPPAPTVIIGLAIASAKAALVIMFFMHLKGEKPMVYWPLALTMFLFAALFAFILWSEADHISISMTNDVSIDEPIDSMNASMDHWFNAPIDGHIIDHRSSILVS